MLVLPWQRGGDKREKRAQLSIRGAAMQMISCPNCGKLSGFKRSLGFGTFFMVLLTFGLWLLVIPFYPARCINCGLTRGAARPWQHIFVWIGVALFVVVVFHIAHTPTEPVQPVEVPQTQQPSSNAAQITQQTMNAPAVERPPAASAQQEPSEPTSINATDLLAAYEADEEIR